MPVSLLLAGLLTVTAGTAGNSGAEGPRQELSKAETEKVVRNDLSARLKIAADALRVVESTSRTWPDQRLGCPARRGLVEPAPVPGFVFVLEAGGRRHTYHTDTFGVIVRCEAPKKPVDPISR